MCPYLGGEETTKHMVHSKLEKLKVHKWEQEP